MDRSQEAANSLNSSQKLHLLTSCQYADKLLAEVEGILVASTSKSPFPKYKPDLSPPQAKVVQDYIARIRAQMLRILEGQGIRPPEPQFGSIHSIRVTLGFADITFDECRPKTMRGYGEVPPSALPELNGLVDEMKGLLAKLDSYLAQGLGQDLRSRLQNLQQTGAGVSLVTSLERIINAHGFVEFRPALANIVGRLESTSFEIAVFGRVSCGKSSLLNCIVQNDVLPVGVTPVTAVPTRIIYGRAERAVAWFAGRSPEQFDIARLSEFATEQSNPANSKHVTRIVVELPSPRLRDGVVYVDTPGLGSLARAGAAETMAYLPRCDLGVVLIDAGAALTADDLSTIRALYEAGIPAFVLLSKSDLLAPADRERLRQYVASHIRSELDLDLPVHPVSVRQHAAELLETWFEDEIRPLYDRHVDLSRESLNRKIGALRAGVEAALQSRLGCSEQLAYSGGTELRMLETELRRVAGRFADVRAESLRIAEEIRGFGARAIAQAAEAIVAVSDQRDPSVASPGVIAARVFEQLAAGMARPITSMLKDLAHGAADILARTAAGLVQEHAPEDSELAPVIKDMPRLDIGRLDITVPPSKLLWRASPAFEARRIQRRLHAQIDAQVAAAFSSHGKLLEAWVRRTLADLQTRFDSYADAYRAQLDRLTNRRAETVQEEEAIRRDLAALAGCSPPQITENANGS